MCLLVGILPYIIIPEEGGVSLCNNQDRNKSSKSGFYLPMLFKEAYKLVKIFDKCWRTENISKKNEMPSKYFRTGNIQCLGYLTSWDHCPLHMANYYLGGVGLHV